MVTPSFKIILNDINDKIRDHLIAQNKQAVRIVDLAPDGCAYRADDGCKCAVGTLIRDEFYSKELEGKAVHQTDVLAAVLKSLGLPFMVGHIESDDEDPDLAALVRLLGKWQCYHDTTYRIWTQRYADCPAESPTAFHLERAKHIEAA